MGHNIYANIEKYKGDKYYELRFFRISYKNDEGEVSGI